MPTSRFQELTLGEVTRTPSGTPAVDHLSHPDPCAPSSRLDRGGGGKQWELEAVCGPRSPENLGEPVGHREPRLDLPDCSQHRLRAVQTAPGVKVLRL